MIGNASAYSHGSAIVAAHMYALNSQLLFWSTKGLHLAYTHGQLHSYPFGWEILVKM